MCAISKWTALLLCPNLNYTTQRICNIDVCYFKRDSFAAEISGKLSRLNNMVKEQNIKTNIIVVTLSLAENGPWKFPRHLLVKKVGFIQNSSPGRESVDTTLHTLPSDLRPRCQYNYSAIFGLFFTE